MKTTATGRSAQNPLEQWGRLVKESAKMIKHIDPTTELTAAALTDLDWNISLLKNCSDFLDWISIHEYWDPLQEKNQCATYEEAMAYTNHVDDSVREHPRVCSPL